MAEILKLSVENDKSKCEFLVSKSFVVLISVSVLCVSCCASKLRRFFSGTAHYYRIQLR